MKENGRMVSSLEKEDAPLAMVMFTKEIGSMDWRLGGGKESGLRAMYIRVTGRMGNNTDKGNISGLLAGET